MDENALLSRKELAAALGVSPRTVDRWIRDGTGPPAVVLPSGRRRWRWGTVQAWVRDREAGSGATSGLHPVQTYADASRRAPTPSVLVSSRIPPSPQASDMA